MRCTYALAGAASFEGLIGAGWSPSKGPLTCLASSFWLLAGVSASLPGGLSTGLLERPHGMVAGFP